MKSKEPTIFLNGKPVKIIGGDFRENVIIVKRLFAGAVEMEVSKEILQAEGGYLEIYKEIERCNNENGK